jgi:hypothetical protein
VGTDPDSAQLYGGKPWQPEQQGEEKESWHRRDFGRSFFFYICLQA